MSRVGGSVAVAVAIEGCPPQNNIKNVKKIDFGTIQFVSDFSNAKKRENGLPSLAYQFAPTPS